MQKNYRTELPIHQKSYTAMKSVKKFLQTSPATWSILAVLICGVSFSDAIKFVSVTTATAIYSLLILLIFISLKVRDNTPSFARQRPTLRERNIGTTVGFTLTILLNTVHHNTDNNIGLSMALMLLAFCIYQIVRPTSGFGIFSMAAGTLSFLLNKHEFGKEFYIVCGCCLGIFFLRDWLKHDVIDLPEAEVAAAPAA